MENRVTVKALDRLNGIVEDLGSAIGYSATAALVDWFGGGNLYVPQVIDTSHPICKVIGPQAFARLIKEWGGEEVWLPLGYQREQDRRDRMIAVLMELGLGSKQVAAVAGMSERHVQHIRLRLEEMGVLALILAKAGLTKPGSKTGPSNSALKPGSKTGPSNSALKPGGKTGSSAAAQPAISCCRSAKSRKSVR